MIDESGQQELTCEHCWRETAPEDPCWMIGEACLGPKPETQKSGAAVRTSEPHRRDDSGEP